MLAVSNGRITCLSTPYGKRGFFYNAWAKGGDDWARIEIPAQRIARISPEFLASERRSLGESWFRQEYCCSFEALEGLVYPDFARCIVGCPGSLHRRWHAFAAPYCRSGRCRRGGPRKHGTPNYARRSGGCHAWHPASIIFLRSDSRCSRAVPDGERVRLGLSTGKKSYYLGSHICHVGRLSRAVLRDDAWSPGNT
jgi:hypothetical protein